MGNDATLAQIGLDATNAIRSVRGTDFVYGSIYHTLYTASGCTVDFMYETHNVACSTTVELPDTGYYGFLLPERYILPVAEEIYEGYKVMAQAVIDGQCNAI